LREGYKRESEGYKKGFAWSLGSQGKTVGGPEAGRLE